MPLADPLADPLPALVLVDPATLDSEIVKRYPAAVIPKNDGTDTAEDLQGYDTLKFIVTTEIHKEAALAAGVEFDPERGPFLFYFLFAYIRSLEARIVKLGG